jgi:hypothetical protein
MVRTPTRAWRAALGLAALASVLGVSACGGSSSTKTFKLPVQEGDTEQTLYTRAITTAVQYCIDDDKLERVQWSFAKGDVDKPVVQQYTNPRKAGPMSIPCEQVRGQNIDLNQLTSTTLAAPGATDTTDGPSSQDQDEGGRGAPTSSTDASGGGSGSSTTAAPGSSTTVKP